MHILRKIRTVLGGKPLRSTKIQTALGINRFLFAGTDCLQQENREDAMRLALVGAERDTNISVVPDAHCIDPNVRECLTTGVSDRRMALRDNNCGARVYN